MMNEILQSYILEYRAVICLHININKCCLKLGKEYCNNKCSEANLRLFYYKTIKKLENAFKRNEIIVYYRKFSVTLI
jgi:hypothetical protein